MFKAEINRQLMIRADNEVGSLSELTSIMTRAQINLLALCAYEVEGNVAIMFVTDDNNDARKLLQEKGYHVEEEEVILVDVPNQPGALQVIVDKFRESGINMRLLYGSTGQNAKHSTVVIIAEDNLDAMMMIKTELERG